LYGGASGEVAVSAGVFCVLIRKEGWNWLSEEKMGFRLTNLNIIHHFNDRILRRFRRCGEIIKLRDKTRVEDELWNLGLRKSVLVTTASIFFEALPLRFHPNYLQPIVKR
jgi:hypothetical protein